LSETVSRTQGFLSDPNRGDEVVEGTLQLDRWRLRFESPDRVEEISLSRVRVELEEAGDRLCFTDPSRPGLMLFTFDQSLLEHRSFAGAHRVHARMESLAVRRELLRRLRITFYCLAGFLLVTWGGSLVTGAMARSMAARVPPAWEQRFGEEQIAALRETGQLLEDSNQVSRLSALAAPLLRVVPLGKVKVRFYLLDSSEPNAFALPGGHVVVSTGLLHTASCPEEVLGVMAHELAHVTQKHHARKLIAASGPLLIVGLFLGGGDLMQVLGAGTGLILYQGFSQEYEREADEVGWRYLVKANIDPRGMISMFQKLKVCEAGQAEAALKLPQAFSSHPALDKRIRRLESRWKRLPQHTGFLVLTNSLPAHGTE
jgi:beta-barrel assembly-enhancing protease